MGHFLFIKTCEGKKNYEAGCPTILTLPHPRYNFGVKPRSLLFFRHSKEILTVPYSFLTAGTDTEFYPIPRFSMKITQVQSQFFDIVQAARHPGI